jgi:cobalt-zinc-cadmium efflux system protein
MQSVPKGINLDDVRTAMEHVPGVVKVHDLHVWEVTSGVFTLTAHAVIDSVESVHEVLNKIESALKDRFHIEHTTIQLETEDREEQEFQGF